MKFICLLLFLSHYWSVTYSQNHKIINSDSRSIEIEFDFRGAYKYEEVQIEGQQFLKLKGPGYNFQEPGKPWLPQYVVNIGVPFNSTPDLKIVSSDQSSLNNILILPYPSEDTTFQEISLDEMDKEIYFNNAPFPGFIGILGDQNIFRYARIIPVIVSPFQYNPVTRELTVNKKIILEIVYNSLPTEQFKVISDPFTLEYLSSTVVNPKEAANWIAESVPVPPLSGNYWYNPAKDYYKIYLKEKGVYRLTFESLINSGVPLGAGVESDKLEIFDEGMSVPIDIFDGGDLVFGEGDYIQFVGGPPSPTPYAQQNIYNNTNVYWFSYQSDSSGIGYLDITGFPLTWEKTYQSVPKVIHFEMDSLYERLGYAGNDLRDFWFWGKATSQSWQIGSVFQVGFDDMITEMNYDSSMSLRVDMHGLTNYSYCNNEHTAYVELTEQPIGKLQWDDQTRALFEARFWISEDSIHIYPSGNYVKVYVTGDSCSSGSDDIRINWFEMEYNRWNRTSGNNFSFVAPEKYSGINRFWLTDWTQDTMMVYIPSKRKKISDPQFLNDIYKSVLFVDTVSASTEYYCVTGDYYLQPDSIIKDNPSDLRNTANAADYIIISHRKFTSIAEGLKAFRESYFPDPAIPNPRIKIVYIDEIYDEYSYGLLDPFAIQYFLKNAFEQWQAPAPSYVVLMGDMSYDYRQLESTSRENYIPSIPYYTHTYGLAASDNIFAAVSGNDIVPEMAISRFSIETVEEGDILLNKIVNYPADNTKEWKQNALLISSGLNPDDERFFGFNNASVRLEDLYLRPNGIKATKIMRYPNQPQYQQFEGGGPEIRAAINEGAVFVNYYGHGGGYQWDLTFLNDDIYLLENGNKLPFISSVTCYTAHFDNQDVFGEQFIKVPGKGAIAFFGSSGLTLWGIGNYINEVLFNEIFTKREYITGKAILTAKSIVGGTSFYNSQIALLTLLGEPLIKLALPDKPDFVVSASDIKLTPENPIAGDTAVFRIDLLNLGVTFPNDSVTIDLTLSSADTSYSLSSFKVGNFGEVDSVLIPWVPEFGGLYDITLNVNVQDQIPEMDYSDNTASNSFVVYDLSEPNVVTPIDGATFTGPVDFLFSDIGHYLELYLEYYIEIDTSRSFSSPLMSERLIPSDAVLKWISPSLEVGKYFWRTRVFDGVNYGSWSSTRAFTVASENKPGYSASGQIMNMFKTYNMKYMPEEGSLILNTDLLPPKPSTKRFINDIEIDIAELDSIELTSITTDGKYIYCSNMYYFAYDDSLNPQGTSKIYKIGTGYGGTNEGEYYGSIPNLRLKIYNQIVYHSDGFIYAAVGDKSHLLRINPETGDTISVEIPEGILHLENAKIEDGPQLITSDGNYIYNLALKDSLGNNKYTLRIFDPANSWNLLRDDIVLSGTSYVPGFSGFFATMGYIFPSENYWHNEMRRIRAEDGFFEEEWRAFDPIQGYYSWCYDWLNNVVYASVFKDDVDPKISKFIGAYVDAAGNVSSTEIGPASKWNSASYDIINETSNGSFNVTLLGLNKGTKNFDTLFVNIPSYQDINTIDAEKYPSIKVDILFIDSSLTTSSPLRLNSVSVNYETLPEVIFTKPNFTITPDTILQGFDVNLGFKTMNIGRVKADNLKLDFFLDDRDSSFYSQVISIASDSSVPIQSQIFSTAPMSPATLHKIKAVGVLEKSEYFTFNNILTKGFYVARDSIQPDLNITIDGKEIINGDVVSSRPDILITLKDESPLPLDTSLFTVVYNNIPLNFTRPDVSFESSPYPNNEFRLRWNPELPDGRHVLEVLAKDPSGNFSDTIARRIVFYIVNSFDLVEVYNYPNPFSSETYFTFQLYGDNSKLEEFKIKVYTVAGRMIREFDVPTDQLRAGFNKLQWDGRDQDGDLIANGVYFYKVITRNNGEVKTKIQKLAKVN